MAGLFDWDESNRAKVAAHTLTPRECEEAFADPLRCVRRAAADRGEPRAAVIGVTAAGRLLVVVYTVRGERYRVVTAWPARGRDARAYREANP